MMRVAELRATGLLAGRKPQPRKTGSLRSWKKQGADPSLEPLERQALCFPWFCLPKTHFGLLISETVR